MKILLVDPDPDFLRILVPMLAKNPRHLITAVSSGEFALESAASGERVDVLITAVVMEEMDGFALNRRLRRMFPEMRTIFMSAYDLTEYAEQTAGCVVLAEPIQEQELIAALETFVPTAPVVLEPEPIPEVAKIDGNAAVAEVAAVYVPETHATVAGAGASLPLSESVATETERADETLLGSDGNYAMIRSIGGGEWGPVYHALQRSMSRPVFIKVLTPGLALRDSTSRERFRAMARCQAAVHHPSILAVLECGEVNCLPYCTYEYVEGMRLDEMKELGRTIDSRTAVQVLRAVADAMTHLYQKRIAHVPLEARHILVGKHNATYLADVVAEKGGPESDVFEDIDSLSQIVSAVLATNDSSAHLLEEILSRMSKKGGSDFSSWSALQSAMKIVGPKVVPATVFKLTIQDQTAIRAVDESKRRQVKARVETAVEVFALLWMVIGFMWWVGRGNQPAQQMISLQMPEAVSHLLAKPLPVVSGS